MGVSAVRRGCAFECTDPWTACLSLTGKDRRTIEHIASLNVGKITPALEFQPIIEYSHLICSWDLISVDLGMSAG